ncbi:MAG TPA: amidohydrolase family protein [Gaiellaceae bacterium]|nr:amidohydrolase family protein [Gaiellaceae bacterium]
MRQAVSGGWVVPVDGPPLEDAFVAWENGRIVEVGQGRVEDHHEGAIILPGIVNAHSHLEYAVYAGFGDGQPFGSWLGTHIARKRKLGREEMVAIARRGAADSLAAGITTTADYSFSGAAAEAANELGLRAIVYLEVFGSDPGAAAERFESMRSEIEESELVRIGISPHTPYTCSLEVYRYCLSLGVPVGTHLAESDGENEWLEHGTGPLEPAADFLVPPTGKRAVATLAEVLGPELLCAHCVAIDDGEVAVLADADVPVAHCPRSNALLGCGVAPLGALMRAGVRVGLGTDSPASTPSFDPWDELRAAVSAARAFERRPDALGAADALRLATLGSAAALGLEDELGSLTPGKRADLIVLSVAGSPYDPIEDPSVAAVYAGSSAGVIATFVEGRIRYRQGEAPWQEVRSIASVARRQMLV